jgi:sugar lactone lactonase YvrE
MPHTTEVLVDGLAFPEGCRWHDGALFFSDQHDGAVFRYDLDTKKAVKLVDVPNGASGLGWTPEGRLLVVSMNDRKLMRLDPDGLTEVADLSGLATWHCNDMIVDEHGRAWIGNFGSSIEGPNVDIVPAVLIRVDPDGSVHTAVEDLMFPNGMILTPDGTTMLLAESMKARILAFTIGADGALTDRRVWAELDGALPDGICLDAEGAVWSACPLTGRVLRIAQGGEVLDVVDLEDEGRGAFACVLGGEDRRTLFIMSSQGMKPAVSRELRSGRVEAVRVEVPGAGAP